jgi:hypothetical protein
MSTLHELQQAMRRSVVHRDDGAAAALLAESSSSDRLGIYRNTFYFGLTRALRMCFPAIHRLVGDDFFDHAAGHFIAAHPPRAAYLNQYGAEFPDFLRSFAPASSIVYLADVARLEWAINCALHAPDVAPLALPMLETIEPQDQGRIGFIPHPSVCALHTEFPADIIWRAVLAGDDRALAAVDIDAGAAHLRVERSAMGVEATRMDESAWRFFADLCAGRPLQAALASAGDFDCQTALAEHLAAGRFIGFALEHDPEKWVPVFRKDHAQTKSQSVMDST